MRFARSGADSRKRGSTPSWRRDSATRCAAARSRPGGLVVSIRMSSRKSVTASSSSSWGNTEGNLREPWGGDRLLLGTKAALPERVRFLPCRVYFLLPARADSVHGSSTCPSPAEVEVQLRSVLDEHEARSLTAEVTALENGFRVELHRAEGPVVAQRELVSSASCSARARAAPAMIIASGSPSWRSRPRRPCPTRRPSHPLRRPSRLPGAAPRRQEAASEEPSQLELGAGIRGEVGSGIGAGPLLFISAGPRREGWGGSLDVGITSDRTLIT